MGITIRDEAGLFTPEAVKALETAAEAWPFDVRIITSTSASSKDAFDATVAKAVDGADVIAIGLDPTHRTTIVHFGKGADVPPSQWNAVTTAGDAAFKEARWADGVIAIGNRAGTAQQVTTVVTPTETTSPTTFLLLGGVGVLVLAVGIAIYLGIRNHYRREEAMRRLRLDREEETRWWAAHERKHGYNKPRPSSAPPPRYAGRPATTVINNQSGGSGDMAMGFIAGHVSGSSSSSVSHSHAASSYDGGGSSSSWSGDSGGGSSDAGGSSSSW